MFIASAPGSFLSTWPSNDVFIWFSHINKTDLIISTIFFWTKKINTTIKLNERFVESRKKTWTSNTLKVTVWHKILNTW